MKCEYCGNKIDKGRFCNKSCIGKWNTLVRGNYKRKQTVLKIECAYCHADMGTKPGYGVTGITSSICRACWIEQCPADDPYPEDNEDKSNGGNK